MRHGIREKRSGKETSDVVIPIHFSFRLSLFGNYVAIARKIGIDGVDLVNSLSEFSDLFDLKLS